MSDFFKFLLAGLLIMSCSSSIEQSPNEGKKSVVENMQSMAKAMESLWPSLISYSTFSKPENEKEIIESVKTVQENFAAASSHFSSAPLTVKLAQRHLVQQLKGVESYMKSGHSAYAFHIVRSVPSLCIRCHSQDGASRQMQRPFKKGELESDYDYAEHLFMTRNTEPAIEKYTSFVQGARGDFNPYLEKSLNRLLDIMLKFNKNPKRAIGHFNSLLAVKGLPKAMKTDLTQWIQDLQALETGKGSIGKEIKKGALSKYIRRTTRKLGKGRLLTAYGPDRVAYTIINHRVGQYINKYPKSNDQPLGLLWLAKTERKLDPSSIFSFSDYYLKECMDKYYRSPYAKQCFFDFRDNITFAFTGSRGTEIPDDVLEDLVKYQIKIWPRPEHN